MWDLMAIVLLMADVVGQRNMILLWRNRNHSLTPPRGEWGSLRGVIESGSESNHECSSKKEVV